MTCLSCQPITSNCHLDKSPCVSGWSQLPIVSQSFWIKNLNHMVTGVTNPLGSQNWLTTDTFSQFYLCSKSCQTSKLNRIPTHTMYLLITRANMAAWSDCGLCISFYMLVSQDCYSGHSQPHQLPFACLKNQLQIFTH